MAPDPGFWQRVEEGGKKSANEGVTVLSASILRRDTRTSRQACLSRRCDDRETSALALPTRPAVPPMQARAHVQAERTLEEISDEPIARADRASYPLIGLDSRGVLFDCHP